MSLGRHVRMCLLCLIDHLAWALTALHGGWPAVFYCVSSAVQQTGTRACGADCLAAKEVLRPVAQPPHHSLPLPSPTTTHPPSGAPQMPRYSKRSCAHKPLPVDGLGGRRSDKHGLTLVRKLRRSAPSAALSIHFLSLSLSPLVLLCPKLD